MILVTASIMDIVKGKIFEIQLESCDFTERMSEADLIDLLRDSVEVEPKPPK